MKNYLCLAWQKKDKSKLKFNITHFVTTYPFGLIELIIFLYTYLKVST